MKQTELFPTASSPRTGETVWLWLIKLLTGPLLIILLCIHLIINHLVVEGGLLTYQDVIEYFSNPWVVAMEISFLVVVIIHSMLGLRSIFLDMNPSRSLLKAMNWVLGIAGVAATGYGIWLALVIASRGY